MKRYMLFAGCTYYPSGGMYDLEGCFDSLDAISVFLLSGKDFDWGHVFDCTTNSIMKLHFKYNDECTIEEVLS